MTDDRTQHYSLKLPHADNPMSDDVYRLREALATIDSALHLKATASDIAAAVSALVGAAPSALDTLAELAAAIGGNANLAATIAAHFGAGGTAHSVATALVAGFMSAADKVKLDAVLGTNTGDETPASIRSKLGITTLSGVNTGDQTLSSLGAQAALVPGVNIRTVGGISLVGEGNVSLVLSLNGMSGDVTIPAFSMVSYADRAGLRAMNPVAGDAAVVRGLGLFIWEATTSTPDDDAACFATASGRWILQAFGARKANQAQFLSHLHSTM